jgi:hypothetical protein
MDFKGVLSRFSIFILLFILSIVFACSTPSWFPIKKGPPHKAKMKELLDKEVVILDREEYVKVLNPRSSEGKNQPKYLYIPVNEYLAKRESFTTPAIPKEEGKRESLGSSTSSTQPPRSAGKKELISPSPSKSMLAPLKKKVVIAYFDDRTTQGDELIGDWLAEKLIKEVGQRSQQILFVDYQTVKEFLEKKGIDLTDLETPKVLHLLNEVFGIHALMVGQLSGPYLFTTKADKDENETASAIIKIEMRITDAFSGKTFKNLSASNSIISATEKGSFSEEKAKIKAVDLTIADLGRSLSRELEGLDWFCRVAKVEGDEIYINAGKLTGLKVGDVMEVFRPKGPGERGENKGSVQISAWFGIDASIGRVIQGNKPDAEDILKLAKTSSVIGRGM